MIMKLSDEEMDKVDERFWKTIEWERTIFELCHRNIDATLNKIDDNELTGKQ